MPKGRKGVRAGSWGFSIFRKLGRRRNWRLILTGFKILNQNSRVFNGKLAAILRASRTHALDPSLRSAFAQALAS